MLQAHIVVVNLLHNAHWKNLLPTASGTCICCDVEFIHMKTKMAIIVKYKLNGKVKEFKCFDEQEIAIELKAVEDAVEIIEVYTDPSILYPEGVKKDYKIVIVDTPGTDTQQEMTLEKLKKR